ncbi:hypothetical protein PICMEDRAFT_57926 [Pichia membranifaciens NRRL Y-2026]|uniref:Proteasome activator complex subunit 4 C-terminal domain-containing protein n=1 Tax=Pichia membranifaciens NRRL Y-2026 TaxID=763406 RepID=A0A1E3NPI6_9ASCO|nr:hypothetical protein PICMEDRAFT_57926 [Pichia membranifaciens NRRL Y-2026]ODQ47463.1 hypothetical protein PICMEDRAFT_57926 [Pichia membranifaciens NRRL Y-2026]
MSSPVPEFNFLKPSSRRPINVGKNCNADVDQARSFTSSHTIKELNRLQAYGLDIPNDDVEAERLLHDENSPFFATDKIRKLKNKLVLPYETETIRDQYKYLSHIISHIYIAVKSLDLKSNLTISVEDLEAAKEVIINNRDSDSYIRSAVGSVGDGQKFETLHHNESEAIEDDEDEDDMSDYYDSSDEEDEDAANSTPVMKVEPESASIISLKYWTKELKNLLKMGLSIPLSIAQKLIKVFYAICLSRGQNVDIIFYTQVLTLLTREKKLLIRSGFRLEWEPVYAEFSTTLGNPTTFGPSMKDSRFKKLISFALTVKPFFPDGCIPALMEKIVSKLTVQTVSPSLIHLTVMLPMQFKKPIINPDGSVEYDETDVRHYLPVLFDLWINHKSDKEINCLLSIIMNIAVENLKQGAANNTILHRGVYGIFTKHQYKYIMNQLFLSSQIRHKDNKMVKYCRTLSQLIINSLSAQHAFENEGVVDFLKTYVDAIFTMIHPSNSGPWSAVLSEVVKKLAVSLHFRVQGEKECRDLVPLYHPNYSALPDTVKLDDKIIECVVKTLLPLIRLGSQSKSAAQRRHYNEALQALCYIKPSLVLDSLLPDWYSSFESVNSTHRIPIVINQLAQLARYMVQLPVYRVHLPRFLSMLIPAIDSNDPEKTILTTDFITIVAAVIPFADLTEGSGDGGLCAIDFTSQHLSYLEAKFYELAPASSQLGEFEIPDKFKYDSEFELAALESASSSFKEFLMQFCDNCFKFLELAPAIDNTSTIESQACALISYCFEALIESMSDDLFDAVADKFFQYVSNNVRHEVALVFCNISEAIVRRNPKTQLKRIMDFFMPHVITEIENGAGLSRSQEVLGKDQRLIWNLRILAGAISGAGTEILPYLDDLEKFLVQHTYQLRGTAGLCAAMIANCAFSTISYLKPLERRLISQTWLDEHGGKYSAECWGGFQFSDIRFDPKYLDFKWYKPGSTEVDAVLPTRAPTPTLTDSIEAVDSTLTKRSDILYTYGPHFSNNVLAKTLNPSYQKLHHTRNLIGNCLHELVKALVKKDGSIELIGKVIQCISTWLNDCGYYSSDNELYTDNLHFISVLDLPGVFAPYTRTILGSRLAVYHCSRINISCCTRLPTKLDKLLIRDLVSLAASPYGITASHSASVLGMSLNRVMNCTSVVFNIFKDWEHALLNKDKEILLNIMIMFDKKKLRGLVEKSSSMLLKYEDLLFRSAELNEEEVTVMTMRLFKSIKKYVKIPAAVCLVDEKLLESIRPPDPDVDFKIETLKLAKSKKRAMLLSLLSKLVHTSLSRLSKKLNWKLMLLVMELITTIQSHIEIPLESDVLLTLVKFVDGSHPEISKKGMFWIASIMDTVQSRAFSKYDIGDLLSLKPSDPTIGPLKDILPDNCSQSFFHEIRNIENPLFFIDTKEWIPTSPWNKELEVVKPYESSSFGYNDSDERSIKQFASKINKKWLQMLLQTHIDESEVTCAFFPGIVYFFSSITSLIISGYVEDFTLTDLFEITDKIYKGDERSTHVVLGEVFSGILFACKTNHVAMKFADKEIANRLKSIFDNDLSQSTYKMWSIFSWWLSSHFDMRRTPEILDLICDFEVDKNVKRSPFGLICRLSFLKSYLGSEMNRFHNFEEIAHKMFTILAHPYDSVSKEVSAILFDVLYYESTDCIDTFDQFMAEVKKDQTGSGHIEHKKNVLFIEHLKLFMSKTLELAKENEGKTPQEIVNSDFMFHIKGLSTLLLRILKTSMNTTIVDFICPYILPLALELDKVKDACKLAEISVDALFLILGSIRFSDAQNEEIINLLETNLGWNTPKLTQYKHILAFFGVYGTVRFLERTSGQRKKLMEITSSMLFNQHLYLREQYSYNIKLFIHLFLDSEREEVINFYIKKFKKIIRKNRQEKDIKLTVEQTNLVHGATLGLCALVEAYPYTTPPPKWLPEVLTILEVKCTGYSGIVSRAAKDTLSQFKKTRQDTWHIDSKFFTEEQLEDLEGVLYKSYYL